MMAETKFLDIERVASPSGEIYLMRVVKKGRTVLGELRTYPGRGITVYFAHRKPEHTFKSLKAWAIDTETYAALRLRAVTHIGILVSNGDKYLIPYRDFADKDKGSVVLNYSEHVGAKGKLGAKQWYCPIANFAYVPAPREERETYEIERAKLKVRSRK